MRMIVASRCIGALTVALASALAGRAAAAEPQLASPMSADAVAPAAPPVLPGTWQLAGFDPGLGSTDLEPLRKLVGKAQLVGLGESDHTSGGFYEMKHRLVRFLVEKLGFRLFAIESSWVAAEQTAAFVERCEGSADDALAGLFTIWQSVEVRDLLQWMCEWNQSHPRAKDKVRFTGFDIQDQSAADAAALTEFLLRIGWTDDDPRLGGLDQCAGVVQDDVLGQIPPARYAACIGSLDAISQYFTANSKAIVKQTSKADLEWAKLRVFGLRAWEENRNHASASISRSARDEGMAYTLLKLRELRYPKAKTVVWAHNAHLAKEGTAGPPWDYLTMGSVVRASQGTKYLPIALAADEVSIDWQQLGYGPVAAYGQPGSYEDALHGLGLGDLLVDLRAGGVVPQVLPAGEHVLGDAPIDVRRQFDALVYLDASAKMHPLAWPSCQ